MSDSTPLLQAVGGLPSSSNMQDHNALVIVRGIILVYLLVTAITAADYKFTMDTDYTNWRVIFDFAVITFIMTFIYHAITFSWTFTHLYYPHVEDVDGIEGWIVWAMSLPSNMSSLRKQFYFTMFFTATTVFDYVNSVIYWFVTRQHHVGGGGGGGAEPSPPQESGSPGDSEDEIIIWGWGTDPSGGPVTGTPLSDLFGEGWFRGFNVFNLYAVTSLVMTIEIFFLNSIKRPFAIGLHLLGLVFFSFLYLAWAGIGKAITGWYSFDWLDPSKVGSGEAVTAYCFGFVILAPLMFILMQGFVGIREGLNRPRSTTQADETAGDESLEEG